MNLGNREAAAHVKINSTLLEPTQLCPQPHTVLLFLELCTLTGKLEHKCCESKNEGAVGPVLSEQI